MRTQIIVSNADRGVNHPDDVAAYHARQAQKAKSQAERDFDHNVREIACAQVGLDYEPFTVPKGQSVEAAKADVWNWGREKVDRDFVDRRDRRTVWEIVVPVPSDVEVPV